MKGYGTDYHPSMLDKALDYTKNTLNSKNIHLISLSSRLNELNKLEDKDTDCIMFYNISMFNEIIQNSLAKLIGKTNNKNIILLVDKLNYDENKNPLVCLADVTVELEGNELPKYYKQYKWMKEQKETE